jgi:hypothetical protein
MGLSLQQVLGPASRMRLGLDLFWLLGFGLVIFILARRPVDLQLQDSSIALQLRPGTQVQALLRGGARVGYITSTTHRRDQGWILRSEFVVGEKPAASLQWRLRQDLSLEDLQVTARLAQLQGLVGLPPIFLEQLNFGEDLELRGACALETGTCQVKGRVGSHRFDLPVSIGRGPALASAVYPLLARGRLGSKVEVSLFDGLSFQQRSVTLQLEQRERLRITSGVYEAIRVKQSSGALTTTLWLSADGLVLKEEMPLGISLEHESWNNQ